MSEYCMSDTKYGLKTINLPWSTIRDKNQENSKNRGFSEIVCRNFDRFISWTYSRVYLHKLLFFRPKSVKAGREILGWNKNITLVDQGIKATKSSSLNVKEFDLEKF